MVPAVIELTTNTEPVDPLTAVTPMLGTLTVTEPVVADTATLVPALTELTTSTEPVDPLTAVTPVLVIVTEPVDALTDIPVPAVADPTPNTFPVLPLNAVTPALVTVTEPVLALTVIPVPGWIFVTPRSVSVIEPVLADTLMVAAPVNAVTPVLVIVNEGAVPLTLIAELPATLVTTRLPLSFTTVALTVPVDVTLPTTKLLSVLWLTVTDPVDWLTLMFVLPVRLVTPKLLIVKPTVGPLAVNPLMLMPAPATGSTCVTTLLPLSVTLPVDVTLPNTTALVVLIDCGRLNVMLPVLALAIT